MESKTFRRGKGTLQAFSRSLDIDELVPLVFGGWMLVMVICYYGLVRVKDVFRSHLDSFGFAKME